MSAIEDLITHVNKSGLTSEKERAGAARAELAVLHQRIADLQFENDTLRGDNAQHIRRIAEQARQLAEARELIERQYTGTYPTYTDRCDALRAWLAANATAPQVGTVIIHCEHCGAEIKIVSPEMWTTSEKYATCSTCGARNSKSSIVIQMKSAPQAAPQPAHLH